ncbi:MAG: TonB-dependent receptor plug domain-containing protein, partial [Bacteroidota bacterium]
MNRIITQWLIGLCCLLVSQQLTGQQTTASVLLVDSLTQEPLSFATWSVPNTSQNGVSDLDGSFRITGLKAGNYEIQVQYLGYQDLTRPLVIEDGRKQRLLLAMLPDAVQMEAVVVSAQLDGQRAAIQKQISANGIVNVISKDKINEIPDQNAAETVGRVPGVSLQRDGGEATKVSIRGLSPRYNAITINGERIPATDGEDRSVDLSMVSTDALDGIEVYKSITPDQDGDAVGGTVNFLIKKAKRGLRGDVKASLGYNQLQSEFGQPRVSFSLSNRFLNNKLGIIATGNFQRANRSSDLLTASYVTTGEDSEGNAAIQAEDINLADRLETRLRYGGSLTLDYELERGAISLSSFLGRVDRDETRYRTRYRPESSRKEYDVRLRLNNQLTWNNTLAGTYDLGLWKSELSYGGSFAITQNDRPDERTIRFREDGAFSGDVDETSLVSVVSAANNNLERTIFQQDRIDNTEINTTKYTANVDWKIPF